MLGLLNLNRNLNQQATFTISSHPVSPHNKLNYFINLHHLKCTYVKSHTKKHLIRKLLISSAHILSSSFLGSSFVAMTMDSLTTSVSRVILSGTLMSLQQAPADSTHRRRDDSW